MVPLQSEPTSGDAVLLRHSPSDEGFRPLLQVRGNQAQYIDSRAGICKT